MKPSNTCHRHARSIAVDQSQNDLASFVARRDNELTRRGAVLNKAFGASETETIARFKRPRLHRARPELNLGRRRAPE